MPIDSRDQGWRINFDVLQNERRIHFVVLQNDNK